MLPDTQKKSLKNATLTLIFHFFLSCIKTCCDCNITFLLQLYLKNFGSGLTEFLKVWRNCTAAENNNHLGTLVPSVFLSTSFLQPQMLQSMDYYSRPWGPWGSFMNDIIINFPSKTVFWLCLFILL